MQSMTEYKNVSAEVFESLLSRAILLQNQGATDIILDPCFGFAKTRQQNFEILSNLRHLTRFGFPVMAGLSRKSMVYQTLNISPEDALNGSTALHAIALTQGTNILRVHDVMEAVQCVRLYQELSGLNPSIN
jgi:dihydropteroate synthase